MSIVAQRRARSRALFEQDRRYSVGLSSNSRDGQLAFERGEGSWLYDFDGNQILDFTGGMGIASLGHCHPDIAAAIQRASQTHQGYHDSASADRVAFYDALCGALPHGLNRFAMYSGGAETVEAGVRAARAFTGRPLVLGLTGGFHGKTAGAATLSGLVRRTAGPDALGRPGECTAESPACEVSCTSESECPCAATLQAKLGALPQSPAAVIVEPVQGRRGNYFLPRPYLVGLRQWCTQQGVLLIGDEILTGTGKSGRFCAFEHSDVVPDILLLGKGLGGGYPVGVLACKQVVGDHTDVDSASASSTSFGGNPLAAAAARATVDVIKRDDLLAHVAELGRTLSKELATLTAHSALVGVTHNIGLLAGIRLSPPAGADGADCAAGVVRCALEEGLLIKAAGDRLRINPPLVLRADELAQGLSMLRRALQRVEESVA